MSVVGCARALRCLNTKSATSDGVVMHFSTRSRAPAYFAARCPTGSYAKYWSSSQIIPVMAGVSITVWAHAQSHTSVSSPMQEWMTWHCPSHFSQAEQQCCVLLYHQHIHQCLTLDCASSPRTPPHTRTHPRQEVRWLSLSQGGSWPCPPAFVPSLCLKIAGQHPSVSKADVIMKVMMCICMRSFLWSQARPPEECV